MSGQDLNERQRFALLWLDEHTTAGEPLFGGRGAFAYALGDAMVDAGLLERRNRRHGASQGAANALAALRRRDLADNSTPGGEAFQAVEWGITEAGHRCAIEIGGTE